MANGADPAREQADRAVIDTTQRLDHDSGGIA
jgi:hypothetical protein